MDSIPHLALPLAVSGPSYITVQQDTVDELQMTVAAICAFPLGSRVERPEFGVVQPHLADEPLAVGDIEQAVESYEPRAVVTVTELELDPRDPLAARIQVQVSMARAQEEEVS